ncbi:N-(5'-phosphoribosyl)anthranilate isomerase [Roseovarius faecimaris]|uniref:N-(5'-phosphoribosyl)anthranilate isomerase n=1 Tax=Roseovarius faecimaris TaxID=2494550 RepID=A0A6I6IQJ2_9RHOB|nr:N-(5'-phosphoribosyl)anthranilate isomerase [Roseovarius faecimaris]QGX99450.1 N-(5'-phosphoribosyl)anthranilate isomerase [Roseovarius faecimaris]
MQMITRPTPAAPWIAQLFNAKSARKGAVVRRSMAWVHREVGREEFVREIQRRGYHLIETADQFIVVCHNGPIRILF